ncbi:Fe-S cluster assembly protein SufD [Methylohalobius crimeensis]|uniref:Fe-S cluster assembly protein SufD n=1 Tax=Methylohalobius crimeensis TaxID=244365 RepID=UPI0003B4D089|nr:Fe-S cluster assembly protein SufD [Methylohalobius crimeensis]
MTMPASVTPYQSRAESLAASSPDWLAKLRRGALARFAEQGFPSLREEEWKYTNVAPIERKRFPLAEAPGQVDPAWAQDKLLPDCWHLVLIDGHFARDLSSLPERTGETVICDFNEALDRHSEWLTQGFGRAVDVDHGFIDFNTALFQGGAFIHLSAGARLEKPIQILHLQTQAAAAASRHLILLEEGAEATVIETYAGSDAGLTAHIGEVLLEKEAHLQHFKIQEEAERSFHFGGLYVKQAPHSHLTQNQFALGGFLARSEIHVTLDEGSACHLDGLHWARGRRHLDSHTRIVHAAPNGTSRENYKALADDSGHSVFQGRILVQPHAQKTDSAMHNRNLILSDKAEVDSKPQLEIYADDVQCAHGVTVGQLDDDALFYLETRGLDADAARQLLIYGFVNELIEAVPVMPLRAYLHRQLDPQFNAIDLKNPL